MVTATHLVVDVGLTPVAPNGQIREAQDQRVFGPGSVIHHVFVNITTTEHLGGETAGETGETAGEACAEQVRQVTW